MINWHLMNSRGDYSGRQQCSYSTYEKKNHLYTDQFSSFSPIFFLFLIQHPKPIMNLQGSMSSKIIHMGVKGFI